MVNMLSWIRRGGALCLLFAVSLPAEIRSLTILHSNDLHARLTPLENGNGGFAYLASVLRRERAGCRDCIYLNAGDLVQGTPVSTIFHGLPVYEIANLLKIDASTLGNHEFDYGWPQVQKFLATARFPVVSANVVNDKGNLMTREPYIILRANGLRIAVIGAMTDRLDSLTTPKLLGEWHTMPLLDTVRKYAAELRPKSDLVVLLGHITDGEETEVLEKVPGVSVIVSGHVHKGMAKAESRDNRVLVRVKGYGEELGRLSLEVDTEKKELVRWDWKRIRIDSTRVRPDAAIAKVVKRWEDEVTARVDQPLAVSSRSFTKAEVKLLIERAMREQTGSNFAFMNLGGVRDVLPKGQLLVRHIWNIMPFDNMVVVGTFKGRQIPQVVAGAKQLDPDRDYTFAVSDFTAANPEGEGLKATGLKFPNEVGLLRDILVDWFRKKKTID
jgi:2',3'-cyclic-nucleotide 2'-phosphodiesterase (5'-nucleotidase family)